MRKMTTGNVEKNDGRLKEEDFSNPALAEQILLEDFGARRGWGPVFLKMKRMGLVPPLVLDPGSWVSFSSGSVIRLGIKPTPAEIKAGMVFEGEGFDYHDDIAYKLGHELSHRAAPVLGRLGGNEGFMNLFDCLLSMRRRDGGKGITALGGQAFYRTQGGVLQATEDLVELLNMYLWDADYFDRYLKFLANDGLDAMRVKGRVNLTTISPEVGAVIKRYLRTSVEKLGVL